MPGSAQTVRPSQRNTVFALVVLGGLVMGSGLWFTGHQNAADIDFAATVALVLAPLTWSIVGELRRGRVGVDVIALLAMTGALLTGEYLAGAVIALMLSGGNALEEFAQRRASRELSVLVERAPREAHVRRNDQIVEVTVAGLEVGDVVVVRAGEVVPVDGEVLAASAVLDQSTLTGEPLPVTLHQGDAVMSGTTNAGDAFEMEATHTSADSAYASIVMLVTEALARKAPMVRMADRFGLAFLALTVLVSGSVWALTGDQIRALAVLVIATPCPLILAPPVALVAGTSRAARRGIIVKGAAAIERLGRIDTVLIDKTGTITHGTPEVEGIAVAEGHLAAEVLRLAGSLEQHSVHSLAEAIVHAASAAAAAATDGNGGSLALSIPSSVQEQAGRGLQGMVNDRQVTVGSRSYMDALGIEIPFAETESGSAYAHVGIDGLWAGTITMSDRLRADATELVPALHRNGVRRIALLTGDNEETATHVAQLVGVEEVYAHCTPQTKLDILARLRSETRRGIIMVGDGVNDAPALAAADVGIAIGSAGATAASETAEAVILPPHISLVADAIAIGQRSRGIALQSIVTGMALSIIGMGVAAAGYLPPVDGAFLQEGIDLAVILNALRALGEGHAARS